MYNHLVLARMGVIRTMGYIDEREIKRRTAWKIAAIVAPMMGGFVACYVAGVLAARACHLPPLFRLLAGGAVGIAFLEVYMKISSARYRRTSTALREAMDDLTLQPANEADYAWLDSDRLREWSFHIASLGFRALGDYTVGMGGAARPRGISESFIRLMLSDENDCFAAISQRCVPGEKPKAMACVLTSLYTSGDSCTTTTADILRPDLMPELTRNVFSCSTDSAAELLRAHLEQRDRVAEQGGLGVKHALSLDTYMEYAAQSAQRVREMANRRLANHGSSNCI